MANRSDIGHWGADGPIVLTVVTNARSESANSARINYRLQENSGLSPTYNGSPFIRMHNASANVIASDLATDVPTGRPTWTISVPQQTIIILYWFISRMGKVNATDKRSV